jgi:hypothetical protein
MNQKKGVCFKAAYNYLSAVTENDFRGEDFVLVHGNVAHLPQDKGEVNHAWVEEEEIVHEVSNGEHRVVAKTEYYYSLGVTTTRRYSLVEALKNVGRTKNYGPW